MEFLGTPNLNPLSYGGRTGAVKPCLRQHARTSFARSILLHPSQRPPPCHHFGRHGGLAVDEERQRKDSSRMVCEGPRGFQGTQWLQGADFWARAFVKADPTPPGAGGGGWFSPQPQQEPAIRFFFPSQQDLVFPHQGPKKIPKNILNTLGLLGQLPLQKHTFSFIL